jgi:hypothetical protein
VCSLIGPLLQQQSTPLFVGFDKGGVEC